MSALTGGCLCGAVRYVCEAEPMFAGHCQCRDCRRETGSGHSSHFAVPEESLTLTGTLQLYESPTDSGSVSTRGFCPVCGSPILYRSKGMPGFVLITAGSLDDPARFEPTFVVFAAGAATWDTIDPALERFEGMPPRD